MFANLPHMEISAYQCEQERLARLVGGVAVLQIGGASEVEVGEKKVRIVLDGYYLFVCQHLLTGPRGGCTERNQGCH